MDVLWQKSSFLDYDYFCKNISVKFEFLTDKNCWEIRIYVIYRVKLGFQ